jgi:hypothetical protein
MRTHDIDHTGGGDGQTDADVVVVGIRDGVHAPARDGENIHTPDLPQQLLNVAGATLSKRAVGVDSHYGFLSLCWF